MGKPDAPKNLDKTPREATQPTEKDRAIPLATSGEAAKDKAAKAIEGALKASKKFEKSPKNPDEGSVSSAKAKEPGVAGKEELPKNPTLQDLLDFANKQLGTKAKPPVLSHDALTFKTGLGVKVTTFDKNGVWKYPPEKADGRTNPALIAVKYFVKNRTRDELPTMFTLNVSGVSEKGLPKFEPLFSQDKDTKEISSPLEQRIRENYEVSDDFGVVVEPVVKDETLGSNTHTVAYLLVYFKGKIITPKSHNKGQKLITILPQFPGGKGEGITITPP